MAKFKYTLFYDFHTSTILPDVGANFDVEKFTDDLVEAKVDYLTWHARCNQGSAYYDTQIGYKHPSLKRDLFGEIVKSCHKKGIRVSAYFNGGLSDEELLARLEKTNRQDFPFYLPKKSNLGFIRISMKG